MITAGLALVPPAEGYADPLSFQFERQEPAALGCLAMMVGTMCFVGLRLVLRGRFISSCGCFLVVAVLMLIFVTDARSATHLGLFICLAVMLVAWQWGLCYYLEEEKLALPTWASTMALFICGGALGIGERLLLISTIVSMNVALNEHVLVDPA